MSFRFAKTGFICVFEHTPRRRHPSRLTGCLTVYLLATLRLYLSSTLGTSNQPEFLAALKSLPRVNASKKGDCEHLRKEWRDNECTTNAGIAVVQIPLVCVLWVCPRTDHYSGYSSSRVHNTSSCEKTSGLLLTVEGFCARFGIVNPRKRKILRFDLCSFQ